MLRCLNRFMDALENDNNFMHLRELNQIMMLGLLEKIGVLNNILDE